MIKQIKCPVCLSLSACSAHEFLAHHWVKYLFSTGLINWPLSDWTWIYIFLRKQCRSISAGFWWIPLIRICHVFHVASELSVLIEIMWLNWRKNRTEISHQFIQQSSLGAQLILLIASYTALNIALHTCYCLFNPYIHAWCILNETSKPPVNKAHFFNITHLLLNCLKWYLPQYIWTHICVDWT